ncbi:MAG: cadherin repeat domain-containing protein [Rubripirellula sp.]
MTQRERFLAILVGGLLIAGGIWWGIGNYRSAVKKRTNEITRLQQEQQRLTEQQLQGEYANRQMGEYMVRSLPGDLEIAQGLYQQWLISIVQQNDVRGYSVDPLGPRPVGGLYQQMSFRVLGTADIPKTIGLLHSFYAKDYLHRIRDLSVRPAKTGGFTVEMTVDAVALMSAPDQLPERDDPSWRVDDELAVYRDTIMNRNLFQPPNQAPSYAGSPTIEAIIGRNTPAPLAFKDAEGNSLKYELVDGPTELVSLNASSGTLEINSPEKQEFPITVMVTDNGYPARTTEQKLTVKVVDPPPPPTPEPEKPKFDDATQTVLTGLVKGRGDWEAWMHVRTRDKTLKLRVGDKFEIGTLKGEVVEVTRRYAVLEIDGRRFNLEQSGNLSEAAKAAEED